MLQSAASDDCSSAGSASALRGKTVLKLKRKQKPPSDLSQQLGRGEDGSEAASRKHEK
jgi:hypothetical protein